VPREISVGVETLIQFIEEREIEINLFVAGAVERPARGLRATARGLDRIPEKHELRVAIAVDHFVPVVLRVVEHEGDELNFFLLGCVARRIGSAGRAAAGANGAGVEQRRNQVALEDEAEHEQHEYAADADVHAAETAATGEAAPAAVVTTIFNIVAGAAWSPSHECRLAS
jgi:hypothetical protein